VARGGGEEERGEEFPSLLLPYRLVRIATDKREGGGEERDVP